MAEGVLVIDAGTSALRGVFVSRDGEVTWSAAHRWTMTTTDDGGPFARELDARDALEGLCKLLAAAPADVRGVALTGQREGVAFLDGRGDPLFVSPNIDGRASAEGMAIDARLADAVYAATGHLPSMIMAPAKLAWLRNHRPEVAERVASIVPLADWLAMALTGGPAMSRSLGIEIGLLDVTSGEPLSELLQSLGVRPDLVCPTVDDGAVVGKIRDGALAGTPVVLAGGDTQCALLGMGTSPGEAGVPAGWSAPVQLVTTAAILDRERRTWTGRHTGSGYWVLESNASETGRAWEWVCGLLGATNDEAFALAAGSPVGAHDGMMVLGPRRMNASAMNAGVGAITMPLPFVMSSLTRGDVARVALESIAFAIRANLEQLEEISGAGIPVLRLGAGMSRQPPFAQILADVVGRPVPVARSAETSAVGAAALAATTIGWYATLGEAMSATCSISTTVEPDVAASAQYDDLYERWCAMADALATEAW